MVQYHSLRAYQHSMALEIEFVFFLSLTQIQFFLTVPPNFQYQNEKRWAANQRFCSMFDVQMILVGWTTFLFLALKFGRNSWKTTL